MVVQNIRKTKREKSF